MNSLGFPQAPVGFLKFGTAGAQARVRLYCFAHAGGTASTFAPWARLLAPDIEVWAVELPGHGTRMDEKPLADVRAIVNDVLSLMVEVQTDVRPFAFYGHSLGAVIAYETALAVEQIGTTMKTHRAACIMAGPMPPLELRHLFVGAARAPHLPPIFPPLSHLDQDAFLTGVQQRYGGISEAVLAEPELLEMILPQMRADFAAYEGYRHSAKGLLACPVTAFAGTLDPVVKQDAVAGWADHTSGPFRMHAIPGDHFFLAEHREEVLGILSRSLKDDLATESSREPETPAVV